MKKKLQNEYVNCLNNVYALGVIITIFNLRPILVPVLFLATDCFWESCVKFVVKICKIAYMCFKKKVLVNVFEH